MHTDIHTHEKSCVRKKFSKEMNTPSFWKLRIVLVKVKNHRKVMTIKESEMTVLSKKIHNLAL